jgi:hypothetical protein
MEERKKLGKFIGNNFKHHGRYEKQFSVTINQSKILWQVSWGFLIENVFL